MPLQATQDRLPACRDTSVLESWEQKGQWKDTEEWPNLGVGRWGMREWVRSLRGSSVILEVIAILCVPARVAELPVYLLTLPSSIRSDDS